MNEIQKAIHEQIAKQRLNILKSFSELGEIEKGNKYISKYIGKNGNWVYVYNNPNAAKKQSRLNKIDDEIRKLSRERRVVMNEMENDPSIEVEGGKIANSYGDKLNKIDEKIDKYKLEKNKIIQENPDKIHEKTNQTATVRDYEYERRNGYKGEKIY